MAQTAQSMTPKGQRVRKIYDMINKTYPDQQNPQDQQKREEAYEEITEMELKRLNKALETGIANKMQMVEIWQALIETGELQEMLSTIFMAAKQVHRITISHLYDNLNLIFSGAESEIAQAQANMAQQAQAKAGGK